MALHRSSTESGFSPPTRRRLFPRTLLLIFTALLGLAFAACSGKLTPANLAKIQPGMSQAEVLAFLGEPERKENTNFLGLHGSAWIYRQSPKRIAITFVNDRVVTKEGSLEP